MGSVLAAIAAVEGRGDSASSGSNDYRIVLPPLPAGEAMKRAVILHCDISGRPYRLEDFRKPLKDIGVIGEVTGIGAYQMSHVWLLDMRSDEAKKKLLDVGQFLVKEKACLVVNPTRQEVRVKLHWVAFDVTNDTIRRAFGEYGEVKEVTREKWRVADFEGVESTARLVRLVLHEGVSLDRLPHQLRIGSGAVLVVVPGRAPMCLRCRTKGHIRRDCRVPKCSECRAFGHVSADCTRSYVGAVGRGTDGDHSELVMDEDEAEGAAAPATAQSEPREAQEGATTTTAVTSGADLQPVAVTSRPEQPEAQQSATPESGIKEVNASGVDVPVCDDVNSNSEMEVEWAASKRRCDASLEASQERRLSQLEKEWKVVGGRGKKMRVASQGRSSSLPRGDKTAAGTPAGMEHCASDAPQTSEQHQEQRAGADGNDGNEPATSTPTEEGAAPSPAATSPEAVVAAPPAVLPPSKDAEDTVDMDETADSSKRGRDGEGAAMTPVPNQGWKTSKRGRYKRLPGSPADGGPRRDSQ
ncbi:uncharacterized protein ISCGN_000188 [Ixodes scapularis]